MNRDPVQFNGRLKVRWALISDDEFTALARSSARQLSDWHQRMRQTVGLTRNSA